MTEINIGDSTEYDMAVRKSRISTRVGCIVAWRSDGSRKAGLKLSF
jgi:hypothetical protein